jgi:hypothetical protein
LRGEGLLLVLLLAELEELPELLCLLEDEDGSFSSFSLSFCMRLFL